MKDLNYRRNYRAKYTKIFKISLCEPHSRISLYRIVLINNRDNFVAQDIFQTYLKTSFCGLYSHISLYNARNSYKSRRKLWSWTFQNILKPYLTVLIRAFPCTMYTILINHEENGEVGHSKISWNLTLRSVFAYFLAQREEFS